MITTLILNIIYGLIFVIASILELLGPIPSGGVIVDGINVFSSYLSPLNNILPLTTILSILFFEIVFEVSYFTYKAIKWGYSKIPGVT
jgi:hypothetical protein